MKSTTHLKRGVGLALSVLFINSAFADSATDARIQAYKANKLIPETLVLATSTNATSSQEVVSFSPSALTWNKGTASQLAMNALALKYGNMSLDEIKLSMGPSGTYDKSNWEWVSDGWLNTITTEVQELREYLSAVANGKIQSEKITSSGALSYLQEQFDAINSLAPEYYEGYLGAFPCAGLDFSNVSGCIDFSQCTGITGEQIAQAGDLTETILPAVKFSGSEDLSGHYYHDVDFSQCTGITSSQLMSASNLSNLKLPAIAFNGTEDFTGKDVSITDFSKCTGITGTQILSASNIMYSTLPAIAFNGTEDFSNIKLTGTDLSQCTGITGTQILSANDIAATQLPAITFNGTENFTGKKLTSVDLTKCTGITGEQIAAAEYITLMSITSAQYNEWKPALLTKFKNSYVKVDGVRTQIK